MPEVNELETPQSTVNIPLDPEKERNTVGVSRILGICQFTIDITQQILKTKKGAVETDKF